MNYDMVFKQLFLTVKSIEGRFEMIKSIITARILRSEFVQIVLARISTCSDLRCILFASCHYCNYSCMPDASIAHLCIRQLSLSSFYDSCTRLMSSEISNIIDNWRWIASFVFRFLEEQFLSNVVLVYRSWISIDAFRHVCACWLIKYLTMIG